MNPQLKILGVALICCAVATGCTGRQVLASVGLGAAAGAGVAAYVYTQGDLEADLKHKLKDVYKATTDVVKSRDYDLKDHDLNDDEAKITAEIPNKDDKALKINLKKDGDKTHISIRVGVFGDEDLSKDILKDIEKELK